MSGVPNAKTTERNSRIGATASIPISKHQSLKFSYNNGAYITLSNNRVGDGFIPTQLLFL